MVLAPGTHIGRFDVVRHLGDGGLASVYLVQHRTLASLHALKLLHAASPKALKRFVQEGQVQAKIRHPNVVAVTDVVELSDQVALVMEFVEGTTLADVIADDKPLSRRDVVQLFSQICAGVSAAHALGVLHRDLKPANVLLSVHDRGVTAKIADFGIAKVARELSTQRGGTLTETGTTMGTPGYMAPEQILDAATVDVRADVFALGAILYELIANRSPFARRERSQTIAATLNGEHVPLGDRIRGLPPAFIVAVERAIALDPGMRFASVADFERAVLAVAPALMGDSMAEEEPVAPAPPARAAIVRPPPTAIPVPGVHVTAGRPPPARRPIMPVEPVEVKVRVVAPPGTPEHRGYAVPRAGTGNRDCGVSDAGTNPCAGCAAADAGTAGVTGSAAGQGVDHRRAGGVRSKTWRAVGARSGSAAGAGGVRAFAVQGEKEAAQCLDRHHSIPFARWWWMANVDACDDGRRCGAGRTLPARQPDTGADGELGS